MRNYTRWVLPLGVALVVRVASADEESDRRALISQIEAKLDAIASELSGMERKSDGGDIDDAQVYAREVERWVDELKRVKGSDANADRIVISYPGHLQSLRIATDELKKLKLRQTRAEDYLRQCKAFDTEMTARANATADDPRGAEDLYDFAKSIGRKGEELLSEAQRQWSEVERGKDDVRRFSASEGRWSNVRGSLHASAEAISRAWRDDWDKAKSACDEVVKRERHKDVERTLGKLAATRAGRAELRKKLDDLLATVAERVRDIQSHSSTSYVIGALEITKELDSLLERLNLAAGNDPSSRRIASTWPLSVRELREALGALQEMKINQSRADEGSDKCEAAERSLQERIRRAVSDPAQHNNARELSDEADRIGNPIKEGIERASEVDRRMESWLNKAKSFEQTEGAWSRISSNLRDSADRVFRHWRDHFGRMKKACERITLGKDNPDVRRGVEEMGRDMKAAGDTYRGLREEFNRWKSDVDRLREFTARDVEEIRREFCMATDHNELGSVNEIADRWASQISNLYGSITGIAERIKHSADDLIAKRRALKNAPKVKQAVDEILASIAKVKNYELAGSNNPLLKARAQYGDNEHRSKQSGCDATEITISGNYCRNPNPNRRDCRLDCIKGCAIIEIKPDGAQALGNVQLDAYITGLTRMHAALGDSMFKGELARLRQCVDRNNELKLDGKVDTYQFCPTAEQLGSKLERIDRTIPAEAE